jgi:hypothetical protein
MTWAKALIFIRKPVGLPRHGKNDSIGGFPFRCPAGMPKRNVVRSPLFCRDAQKRADNLPARSVASF